MRILVTGGSGFLGREVVKKLVEQGYEVRSLARRAAWRRDLPDVEPFAGSVLEPDSCREALEGCQALIHAAGRVSRDRKDASELMRLHVDGTRNVLTAARDAGVDRVVYLSTSGTIACSEDLTEVKNEAAPYPIELVRGWPYYLSKIYAEQEALRFFTQDQLPVICLNPTLLLGPGDTDGSSTGDVKRFLDGLLPAIPKGGMSFVDVRDVADTVVASLTRGRPGERYLLGAENITTEDFFKRLARMSGRPAPLVRLPDAVTRWGAKLLGRFEQVADITLAVNQIDLEMGRHGWFLDSKKAKLEIGFRPRDPEETLRDTIVDLRERREREDDE
jgi:dihydroflavonol-4-reductase